MINSNLQHVTLLQCVLSFSLSIFEYFLLPPCLFLRLSVSYSSSLSCALSVSVYIYISLSLSLSLANYSRLCTCVPKFTAICTAYAEVSICGILTQMQYRFAVNFGKLSTCVTSSTSLLYSTPRVSGGSTSVMTGNSPTSDPPAIRKLKTPSSLVTNVT